MASALDGQTQGVIIEFLGGCIEYTDHLGFYRAGPTLLRGCQKHYPIAHFGAEVGCQGEVGAASAMAAGGLAAFAAGYGETLVKAGKGLVTGSSGVPTASATRGNSLQPEFRNDPATGVMRHADAGYDIAIECAAEQGLNLPMVAATQGNAK